LGLLTDRRQQVGRRFDDGWKATSGGRLEALSGGQLASVRRQGMQFIVLMQWWREEDEEKEKN
jgi:hypothetical protein